MGTIRGVMPLAALALGFGVARADIPKGVPQAPPLVMMSPALLPSKPAPPLPPTPNVRAVPSAQPSTWFSDADYPAAALWIDISELVEFRLYIIELQRCGFSAA